MDDNGVAARVLHPLGSETEDSSEEDIVLDSETRILKMLRAGNVSEVNCAHVAARTAKVFNTKHDYYRNTRCTSASQAKKIARSLLLKILTMTRTTLASSFRFRKRLRASCCAAMDQPGRTGCSK